MNRLHSLSQIPLQQDEALDQAYVDYKFVLCMRKIDIDTPELRKIEERAQRIISQKDWQ